MALNLTVADTQQGVGESGRLTARDRSRLDTRRRLMEAWREIVIEQRRQAVTISEIAEKAEVAVGTFYCHFKDKDSLTQEVVLDSYSKLIVELDELEARNVDDWRAWTRATLDAVTVFVERHPQEFMFLLRLAPQTTPEGQIFIGRWEQLWRERTEAILRAEMAAGNVTLDVDPVLAARSLVAMVQGLLEWWLEDTSRAPREVVVRTLTSLLLSIYRDNTRG